MLSRVVRLAGGLVLFAAAMSAVFVVIMRSKYPPALRTIRRFNRSVTNPRAMETAGQPGAYAAVIQHEGRKSGAPYETPIGPFPTDEGFVIPLPYGTMPDWLKNVQHAGEATIISEGTHYDVGQPEIISGDEAMTSIPPKYQRSLRWFNVNDFLRVQRADAEVSVEEFNATSP